MIRNCKAHILKFFACALQHNRQTYITPTRYHTHTLSQQKKHLSKLEPVLPVELKTAQNPDIFFDSFKPTLAAFKTKTRAGAAADWKS